MLRPPPKLLPSEWSERHVMIPSGNAIPGPIRFDNAPYQRDVLDTFVADGVRKVTLMWGAQLGKTQLVNCIIGYHIAHDPCSQMVMQPTEGDVKVWLQAKFTPMVEATPELNMRIAKPRSNAGVNNASMKGYPGGHLMMAWSKAPRTMRGRSAPKIYCDEVDGYLMTPEGHPVSLLEQRAATFGDQRLVLVTSTPTLKGSSTVEASYLEGDQRQFHVPCPHCETFQVLSWDNVDFEMEAPETACYVCPHCGCCIDDGQKIAMVRRGQWRAAKPFRGHASFHLSELYSPFRRWRDIVQSYIDKLSVNDEQSFVNVSLAETWEEQGDHADPGSLMARAESWDAVPAGVGVVTAGVDMQADRLEVELVGWGLGEESWSLEHRVFWGDVLNEDVWSELKEYLQSPLVHEDGGSIRVRAACVDTGGTGGMTRTAYEQLRGMEARRMFAIKGVPGWGKPLIGAAMHKKSGRAQRQVALYPVAVDEAKLVVMRRLAVADPGPGYCHFPDDREPSWFAQLTAEHLVTRYVKGHPVREWHLRNPRNEALDCRVYATAALKLVGLDVAKELRKREEKASDGRAEVAPRRERVDDATAVATAETPPPAPKKKKRRRSSGGGFVNSW